MEGFGLAATIVLSFVVVFLPFLFRAGSEGRLRRGAGWYLDVSQHSEGPLPAYRRPPRKMGASRKAIRIWASCGIALGALAVIVWRAFDLPVVGIFLGVLGVVYLGMTVEASRENRWAHPGG